MSEVYGGQKLCKCCGAVLFMKGEIVCGNCSADMLARAYARPAPAVQVPAAWKLVPVEPTQEMLNAGRWEEYEDQGDTRTTPVPDEYVRGVYQDMLAAAPAATVATEATGKDCLQVEQAMAQGNRSVVAQSGGVDDASLEAIIEESSGEWRDDEFRVTGSDLMAMLRKAALLAAAPAIAKQGEGE